MLLTREQFQTLLRDSAPPSAADPRTPPAAAILRSARYSGSPGDKAALLHGEFVVEGLSDSWAELPLTLDPRWLGSVTVDGTAAVSATDQAAILVVHGKGRHVVRMDFAVPLTESAGSRLLALRAPGTAEATLVLTVPDELKIESPLAFTRAQGAATFALPPGHEEFRVTWTARDVPPLETAGIFQDSRFVYTLDAAQVRADLSLLFHAALKNLPSTLALPVTPDTQVLAVEGSELARWSLAGDQVLAEFQPGERREADLRLLLSLPVTEAATSLELPAPVAAGIHRASGSFSLLSHPGLRVRRVTTGALTVRDDTQAAAGLAARPDYRGTWAFPVLSAAPGVEIERLTGRFTATLDTQIALARDAIHLTRHLVFLPRDGTLFSPRVTGLLPGEQIDSVKFADATDAVWQPIDGGLALATPAGTAPGQSLGVTITSRLHPAGWDQLGGQPLALAFSSATVSGAEKVSGYIALDFDETLRVTTPRTDGLEPRDPRQFAGRLALTGRRAWFRLDEFALDLAVSRRPPEFDASVALDVLPLLNTLEVEGQLTLALAHGGLRELTVTFPAAAAETVRWESPLLAEKTLGADGKWTLKFHQETRGAAHLRFHSSLPLDDKSAAGDRERRFAVQVPFPVVDAARRTRGTLVVEANSDTELTFTAQALDDLDTRQTPVIDGYAPRHRLVAGYAWRGSAAALAIDGVRHQPGDLAGTVVDSLTLDSVVSADGPQRHQAVLALRTAGTQFLDVALPEEARVLSVVINGAAAKPIRGPQGALRLPLPDSVVRLQLIYQLPDAKLRELSRTTLPPLVLDPKLPVLETTWRLHLPEGFSYSQFDGNLTETNAAPLTPALAFVVSDRLNHLLQRPERAVASTTPAAASPGTVTFATSAPQPPTLTAETALPAPSNGPVSTIDTAQRESIRRQQVMPVAGQQREAGDLTLDGRTYQNGVTRHRAALDPSPDAGLARDERATLTATGRISNLATGGLRFGDDAISNNAIDGLLESQGVSAAMRAGLLPLEFSLPEGGRTYTFAGKFAPAPLSFRAEAWERQVRFAWIWMVIGGLAFAALMRWRRRPVFIGLLGGLTLHFAPSMAERADWTPIANALLTGWLVALGIVLLNGVARWASRKGRSQVPGEVAHA